MSYQIELFHSLLNNFLEGESALLTTEGDVLAVRGIEPATFGTLTMAAQTVKTYLSLNEGDIAILNDPYSGGSTLNELTFVMAASEDLLWVRRQTLSKSIKAGKTIEEEGIRIPPTPLFQSGKFNETILSAIQEHPACPSHFSEWIKAEFKKMTEQAHKFIESIETIGFLITGELIEEYLQLSKKLAHQRISESASGETRVDVVLDSGELLRLSMDISDGKIALDFGGTSSAKIIHLTESAAFGTCFHTISRYYGFTNYANSGSFASLEITKPSGCWLMAKYPASTLTGMTSGIAALQFAIELALTQINLRKIKAPSCSSPLIVQFQNEYSSIYLHLMGGQGAEASQNGQCAYIEKVSIEKLEREIPVKVLHVEHRQRFESENKFFGGRGLNIKIEALDTIEVTWHSDLNNHKPRLKKNCTLGLSSEITLEKSGLNSCLSNRGTHRLLAGEIISLSSGTGGGIINS